jgi:alpha-L-rhamnosidase
MRLNILASLAALLILIGINTTLHAADMNKMQMWLPGDAADGADSYVAFRGQFEASGDVEIRTLGASWYVVWLDGDYLTEGPPRFPIAYPEYQSDRIKVASGQHTIAVIVHNEGLSTRILDNVPPFLICQAFAGDNEIKIDWKCSKLGGYASQLKRVSPQFAWVEWCDTRAIPANWRDGGFDHSSWSAPAVVDRGLGPIKPLSMANVQHFFHRPKPIGKGLLSEAYGYETDNISARFHLRNLKPDTGQAQGVWRRYDLGRVRLMHPRFVLDLPAGSVVEFAYCEELINERVSPWITLSLGDSCNMDHFVARGGRQEFFPLTPKGGRFAEAHIILPAGHKVKELDKAFVSEEFVERCYYDAPQGAFHSGDKLLDRIWMVGIETNRGCSEDALIDNPTRERGQWAGDVVGVGMDIAAAGYSDIRLCRRALMQCAQCARGDGLVSGLCPGGGGHLSSYAAQWVCVCVRYWELTGDNTILNELFTAAERNIAAFEGVRDKEGIPGSFGWGFIDWGYSSNTPNYDMGLTLHYLAALRDMTRWCDALGKPDRAAYYKSVANQVQGTAEEYFASQIKNGKMDWDSIGYHRAVLGLRLGLLDAHKVEGIAYIKRHMLSCFPNNPDAPRLSDPGANNPMLITPYFAHYSMPLLAENGDMDFVLNQYRKCWGWMLEGGRTTWVEVFDTRWSQCHQWAGAPTWQLTNYVLGLRTRYDLGYGSYVLDFHPGSLKHAEGKLPLPGGGTISIKWIRTEQGIRYTIRTPQPIYLYMDPLNLHKPRRVEGVYETLLADRM